MQVDFRILGPLEVSPRAAHGTRATSGPPAAPVAPSSCSAAVHAVASSYAGGPQTVPEGSNPSPSALAAGHPISSDTTAPVPAAVSKGRGSPGGDCSCPLEDLGGLGFSVVPIYCGSVYTSL
jgi:hypothetical protein